MNIVIVLAALFGFSAHAEIAMMQINYGSIKEVETDLNECVGSKEITLKYSGTFDPVFLIGWYSGRIGSVVESCSNSYSQCSLQDHGNAQTIEVTKLEGQTAQITYCDFE